MLDRQLQSRTDELRKAIDDLAKRVPTSSGTGTDRCALR